ncbi:MAG: cyclic nucleotide-binding domain-containing protein [Actinomycetota bacterium]|nr:cyclic nucleotide-binding domain-containing protein [Actinomycetota bacterium]
MSVKRSIRDLIGEAVAFDSLEDPFETEGRPSATGGIFDGAGARTLPEIVAMHPLLSDLPGDVADAISGFTTTVDFGGGRLLLTEGEPADALYFIRRGHVALESAQFGNGRIRIETLGPGAALGWSWLFPPYRWHFDARAIGPVRAIAVDANSLRTLAERDRDFGYALMSRVSALLLERLQATRWRLAELSQERTDA